MFSNCTRRDPAWAWQRQQLRLKPIPLLSAALLFLRLGLSPSRGGSPGATQHPGMLQGFCPRCGVWIAPWSGLGWVGMELKVHPGPGQGPSTGPGCWDRAVFHFHPHFHPRFPSPHSHPCLPNTSIPFSVLPSPPAKIMPIINLIIIVNLTIIVNTIP